MEFNKSLNAILNENNSDIEFINYLNEYILQVETSLIEFLTRFNWSKEVLLKKYSNKDLLDCPFNTGHTRISKKNFNKHIERCRLKYSNNLTSIDLNDYLKQPNVKSSFQIDISDNVVLFKDLSQQNKLNVYNLAIEKSKRLGYPVNSNWNAQSFLVSNEKVENNKKTSETTLLKRRPKSYRTNKSKSYTETIRDLIQTQMSVLTRKQEEEEVNERDRMKKRRSKSHDLHHHKTKR